MATVLARLDMIRPAHPAIGNDQFVDGKAFRARDLNQDTGSVERDGWNGICDQRIEIIQAKGADPKRGKGFDLFVANGWCQKFDKCFAPALRHFQTPCPSIAGTGSNSRD